MKWLPVTNRDGSVSRYAIRSGDWRICRVIVAGRERYEVWRKSGRTECVARFATADEARAWCDLRKA